MLSYKIKTGLMITVAALAAPIHSEILPAERSTVWNPGLNAAGGIPYRTVIYRTLAPSGEDDTQAIQDALESCPEGQVVMLEPGDFNISEEGLIMNRSYITLRGSGPDRTRLLKDPEINWLPVIGMGSRWSGDKLMSHSSDLASDGLRGSCSITLTEIPDPPLSEGELVLVDQLTDPELTAWSPDSPPGDESRAWFCRMNRPLSQILEVSSVSGPTVTFTTPLHIGFSTAFSAQLSRYGEDWMGPDPMPATVRTGIEDLCVEKGSRGNITMEVCACCWVRNVESRHSEGSGINMISCFRCEIRDSYIHTSDNPNPGGGGYLLSLARGSADNLIENNAIWNANKVMVMRATGGGNVIGYNYFEDAWIAYQPSWVESGANASHMTTPHFELFEGNQAFNFDGESTWGNSIYITVFRNHLTGKRRSVPPLELTDEGFPRAVSLAWGHWWYSFIGNVLGEEDMDPAPYSSYVYETAYPWEADPVGLWKLGVGQDWGPEDPKVLSSVIRHGNFDYVNKRIVWNPDNPDHDLPPSLYLEKKPDFFKNRTWPWVQPENTVMLYSLPARERFDEIHGFTLTGKTRGSAAAVQVLSLAACPNPFNPAVRFEYRICGLPGGLIPVRVCIYDVTGRLIAVLTDSAEKSKDSVVWHADGQPTGIYLARLTAGNTVLSRKVMLIR